MNSNLELLYISLILTFVFIIPFIGVAIYRQLKKYNVQKNDILMGINISKVLINITTSILIESNFHPDKVKLLSNMIIKAIDYVGNADTTDEIKTKEGLDLVRSLAGEMDIILSYDEELIVSDVIKMGIKNYKNSI